MLKAVLWKIKFLVVLKVLQKLAMLYIFLIRLVKCMDSLKMLHALASKLGPIQSGLVSAGLYFIIAFFLF